MPQTPKIFTICQKQTTLETLKNFYALYEGLDECLNHNRLKSWRHLLPDQIQQGLSLQRWGDLKQWLDHWSHLPFVEKAKLSCDQAAITLSDEAATEFSTAELEQSLMGLHPWRKGPFNLFGIEIDTEWRSNLKWARIANHLNLKHKRILDIGCGNGYYGWRMLGQGAQSVVGIDPSPRFVLQWGALKRYSAAPCYVLPIGIEQLPEKMQAFDLTFSMGVMYHRKCAFSHLQQLKDTLAPGGELLLETLIIDGPLGMTLLPKERYAKMRNVWLLPSIETLLSWLERCGFQDAKVLDVSKTTTEEQRSTPWMRYESLEDFLDPQDSDKTIEGYPAPQRVVILAKNNQ